MASDKKEPDETSPWYTGPPVSSGVLGTMILVAGGVSGFGAIPTLVATVFVVAIDGFRYNASRRPKGTLKFLGMHWESEADLRDIDIADAEVIDVAEQDALDDNQESRARIGATDRPALDVKDRPALDDERGRRKQLQPKDDEEPS